LTAFQDDFENEGKGIFQVMREKFPQDYFWGLITLAKVMKIEIGGPRAFDKPSSRDEALDQLEKRAGPATRKMLEKFLDQVAKAEAEYLEQPETATSFKDAASRRR
jgi:hypothetical protein